LCVPLFDNGERDRKPSMSRLNQATERLAQAVTRLEQAVSNEALQRDEAGVRQERDQLSTELAEAQAENARLRETNEAIAGRLDAAIAKLKSVLDN